MFFLCFFCQRGTKPSQLEGARGTKLPRPEVNGLALAGPSALYAACGDGNVYGWDLETRQVVKTYAGHQNAVYCVGMSGAHTFCSGSEDGSVRLWDARQSGCSNVLDPSTGTAQGSAATWSPKPWVSCMDVEADGSWMVCGGGSRHLSLWHLPSLAVTATMPTASAPQACKFLDGAKVLSVGNEGRVYRWRRGGKLIGRNATPAPTLFSISVNPVPRRPHVFSGEVETHSSFAVTGGAGTVSVFERPTANASLLQFR